MNTNDNKIDELENATLDTNEVEQGESTQDWQPTAEQNESPAISIDDFSTESTAPSKEETESLERKKIEKAKNQKQIEDTMFNKYVIQEDWSFNFENLPNDLKWTEKGIKDRYLQEQEQTTTNQALNIEDVRNTLKFEWKLESLVASEDISSEDKAAIRDKFKSLKTMWIKDNLVALQEAEAFVLRTASAPIVWVMPQGWRAPSFSWNQITYEQLDNMSQADYNATMAKADAGEITLK